MRIDTTYADILIVGSGPVGATFARLLTSQLPRAKVVMIDAGPKLTRRAGMHVKNILNPRERMKAQLASQGPAANSYWAASLLEDNISPETSSVSKVLVHPGTFLLTPYRAHSAYADMPAAAMSSNVGGMGSHWTCACPRPGNTEQVPFLDQSEWDKLCTDAEALLHVTRCAFPGSKAANAIVAGLSGLFGAKLPPGRQIGNMPLACTVTDDGHRLWSGPDVILGSLALPETAPCNFELQPETLCMQLIAGDNRITDAIVRHLPSGTMKRIRAQVYVVAGDALRTPQLLWASGIRGKALGHYLNDQPQVVSMAKLSDDAIQRAVFDHAAHECDLTSISETDATVGVFWVPFHDPDHPFHGQVMHFHTPPFLISPDQQVAKGNFVGIGWFCRKDVQYHDCLEFSEREKDFYGMPKMYIQYSLTAKDRESLFDAEKVLKSAALTLGPFLERGSPRVLPAGSSLHYQGTTRMGLIDDGRSVCDTYGQVWCTANLFVGGNGVIPTATACNPTLSSVALAIRSCGRIQSILE